MSIEPRLSRELAKVKNLMSVDGVVSSEATAICDKIIDDETLTGNEKEIYDTALITADEFDVELDMEVLPAAA